MNIYEYLKQDHEKVKNLFSKYEAAEDITVKTEIVSQLAEELIVHSESEQETFYKALEKFEESKEEAIHGKEEHKEIEDKIKQIIKIENSSEALDEKILELKKIVEHHVKEEESNIFEKARKNLSEDEACLIKDQMVDYKQKMLQE